MTAIKKLIDMHKNDHDAYMKLLKETISDLIITEKYQEEKEIDQLFCDAPYEERQIALDGYTVYYGYRSILEAVKHGSPRQRFQILISYIVDMNGKLNKSAEVQEQIRSNLHELCVAGKA